MEKKSSNTKKETPERRYFLLLREALAREVGVENEWNKHYRDLLAAKLDAEIFRQKNLGGTDLSLPSETGMLNITGQNPKYEENQSVPRVEWLNLLSNVLGYENWLRFIAEHQPQPESNPEANILSKIWLGLSIIGVLSGLAVLRISGSRVILGMGWTWVGTVLCMLCLIGYFVGNVKKSGSGNLLHQFSRWINDNMNHLIGILALIVAMQLILSLSFRPVLFTPAAEISFSSGDKILIDWDHEGNRNRIAEFSQSKPKVVWLPVGRNGLVIQIFGDDYLTGDRISLPPGLTPYRYEIR